MPRQHLQRQPGLVSKTIFVTAVAFATVVVLTAACWGIFFGGAAIAAWKPVPTRGGGQPQEAVGPTIPVSARERRILAESAAAARRQTTPAPADDQDVAVRKMRVRIAEVQRERGEEPTGTISTLGTLNVMQTLVTGDSDRQAMLLCVDSVAIRRATVEREQQRQP